MGIRTTVRAIVVMGLPGPWAGVTLNGGADHFAEFCGHGRLTQLSRPPPGNNDRILVGTKVLPSATEELAQPPLDAIAHHRVPYLGTDRDSQPLAQMIVVASDNDEVRRVRLPAPAGQQQELGTSGQAGFLGETLADTGQRSVLGARTLGWDDDGQPLSSLGPPALQHIAAAGGLHSRKETVGSLSSEIARLIRPFHLRTFILQCPISSTWGVPCQFTIMNPMVASRAVTRSFAA